MMDRRDWMFTLAGLVAAPLNTSAQQPMPRIGVLSFGSPPGGANPDPNTGFRDGLRELGYVEGRNLVIEWRYADGRPERLAALAAELVQRKVALILAGGPASMHAARAATATIPIVAVGGSDPVGEGWAQSLARPGGNMTGLTVTFPELGPKKLEILKQAIPGLVHVAVMYAPAEFNMKAYQDVLAAGARALGLELQLLEVSDPVDFEPAFARALQGRAQGLDALATNLIVTHRRRLADLAQRQRLPSITEFSLMAQAGFLLSYGADLNALGRRAATYVDKILKGAHPGELPIERPTHFELVVNLGAARAMGITLPKAFVLRADRVIE